MHQLALTTDPRTAGKRYLASEATDEDRRLAVAFAVERVSERAARIHDDLEQDKKIAPADKEMEFYYRLAKYGREQMSDFMGQRMAARNA